MLLFINWFAFVVNFRYFLEKKCLFVSIICTTVEKDDDASLLRIHSTALMMQHPRHVWWIDPLDVIGFAYLNINQQLSLALPTVKSQLTLIISVWFCFTMHYARHLFCSCIGLIICIYVSYYYYFIIIIVVIITIVITIIISSIIIIIMLSLLALPSSLSFLLKMSLLLSLLSFFIIYSQYT